MHKNWNRGIITAFLLGVMVAAAPQTAYAETEGTVQETVAADAADAVGEAIAEAVEDGLEAGAQMEQTEAEAAAEEMDAEETDVEEIDAEEIDAEEAAQPELSEEDAARQNVVAFALQFLGCPYKDKGTNPTTGFDCSGFTRYVFQNGIGIQLERSSTYQSKQGVQVSENEMKPGDLIFYGSGSRINHVAMYIGDGQVIHASTYETGVKTSPWNYRPHVRIMRVIGV